MGLNEQARRTLSERYRTIANNTPCPKCGVAKGQQCVYMQVRIPAHTREWYEEHRYQYALRQRLNPWDRYDLSGKPMPSIHQERVRLHREQVDRRIARAQRPPQFRGLSEQGYLAARALRTYDVDEYTRLVAWWREWGWLIENANAMRPDGTVRGDTYCLPPR